MPLLVQKYGGSSLANPEKILRAARRAIAAHRQGSQVVVVVSAVGDTTDELIAMARQISERPSARELDQLLATGEQVSVALMAIAIESLGVPAISFTAAQIGILTDSLHSRARIREISTERVFQALGEGKIVIVAGFQGVDHNAEITTLGRGGSDTTAVALAAVLGADACEVYTDVDGVSTADPRIVPEARKIDRISYDEMMELASLGAGVMQSRSIEFAKKYDVPIAVRSSFSDEPGTWIVADGDARRLGWSVTGAALVRDEARITVHGVPDCPESLQTLFRRVAESNVAIDMILKNIMREGAAKVSFTVAADELQPALQAASAAAQEIGAAGVVSDSEVSKVSVVGLGMKSHFGVAATMLEALARADVGVQMITTSEIKISVLVEALAGDVGTQGGPSRIRARCTRSMAIRLPSFPASGAGIRSPSHCMTTAGVRPSARRGETVTADGPGGPGDHGRRARRPSRTRDRPEHPRPPWFRGPDPPPGCRGNHLRRYDRPEHQPGGNAEPVDHRAPERRGTRRRGDRRGRRSAPGRHRAGHRQALGAGRGHALPHRGCRDSCSARWPSGTSLSPWSIPARSRSTWSPVFNKGEPVWKVSETHSFKSSRPQESRARRGSFHPASPPGRSHSPRDRGLLFSGSNHVIEGSNVRGMHRRAGDADAQRGGRSGRLAADGGLAD